MIACTFLLFLGSLVTPVCNSIQHETISIEGEILSLGEHNICKLDLGNVASGEKLVIDATLTSKCSQDLKFNSVSTSCRCTSVTPDSGTISAFGSFKLQIRLDVPSSNSKIRFPAGFHLVSSDGSEISVNLVMNIASNLYVEPVRQFAVSEGFRTFIPISLSEPISFHDLLLEVPESFDGIAHFSLAIKNGQPGIVVTADKSKFSTEYTSGVIRIHDSVSLKSTNCDILLRASQPISINPKIIHFLKKPQSKEAATDRTPSDHDNNDESACYEAKALLRIDSDELKKIGNFKMRCKIEGGDCSTKLTKLTKNLYKIELTYLPHAALSKSVDISWEIDGRSSTRLDGGASFHAAR